MNLEPDLIIAVSKGACYLKTVNKGKETVKNCKEHLKGARGIYSR